MEPEKSQKAIPDAERFLTTLPEHISRTVNIAQPVVQLKPAASKESVDDEPAPEANGAYKAHWKLLKFKAQVNKMRGE